MKTITYTVKVQSHRGVSVVSEFTDKARAIRSMNAESRTAVVVNSSGRIVATNVRRSF